MDSLDKAAELIYKKLETLGGNPLKLSPVQQPIAILYIVQAIVDNGGFRYLFESDFPFNPSYGVFSEAYRKIGAEEAAHKLDRAVALFPFVNPELKQEERNKFMDSLDESHELYTLGDEVCGDKRIWQLMQQYVVDHPEAFLE